jgi:hypothetical protein
VTIFNKSKVVPCFGPVDQLIDDLWGKAAAAVREGFASEDGLCAAEGTRDGRGAHAATGFARRRGSIPTLGQNSVVSLSDKLGSTTGQQDRPTESDLTGMDLA